MSPPLFRRTRYRASLAQRTKECSVRLVSLNEAKLLDPTRLLLSDVSQSRRIEIPANKLCRTAWNFDILVLVMTRVIRRNYLEKYFSGYLAGKAISTRNEMISYISCLSLCSFTITDTIADTDAHTDSRSWNNFLSRTAKSRKTALVWRNTCRIVWNNVIVGWETQKLMLSEKIRDFNWNERFYCRLKTQNMQYFLGIKLSGDIYAAKWYLLTWRNEKEYSLHFRAIELATWRFLSWKIVVTICVSFLMLVFHLTLLYRSFFLVKFYRKPRKATAYQNRWNFTHKRPFYSVVHLWRPLKKFHDKVKSPCINSHPFIPSRILSAVYFYFAYFAFFSVTREVTEANGLKAIIELYRPPFQNTNHFRGQIWKRVALAIFSRKASNL